MRPLAIISHEDSEIERKLSDCVEYLENIGIWVYATHRGRGYAVILADDHSLDGATQLLQDAGFAVALLTQNRSPQIRTPTPQGIVSNQNSYEQTVPRDLHRRD